MKRVRFGHAQMPSSINLTSSRPWEDEDQARKFGTDLMERFVARLNLVGAAPHVTYPRKYYQIQGIPMPNQDIAFMRLFENLNDDGSKFLENAVFTLAYLQDKSEDSDFPLKDKYGSLFEGEGKYKVELATSHFHHFLDNRNWPFWRFMADLIKRGHEVVFHPLGFNRHDKKEFPYETQDVIMYELYGYGLEEVKEGTHALDKELPIKMTPAREIALYHTIVEDKQNPENGFVLFELPNTAVHNFVIDAALTYADIREKFGVDHRKVLAYLSAIRKGRYLANPIDRLIDLLPYPRYPKTWTNDVGIAFNPFYSRIKDRDLGEERSA